MVQIQSLAQKIPYAMGVEKKKKKKKAKQCDTTTRLLERPKSSTVTTPNASKDREQQEALFITEKNTKWRRHFGRQFGRFLQN